MSSEPRLPISGTDCLSPQRLAPLQLPPMFSLSKGYPRCGLLRPGPDPGPSIEGVGAPDVAARWSQGEAGDPAPASGMAKGWLGSLNDPGGRTGGDEKGDGAGGEVVGELKKGGGSLGAMTPGKFGILPSGPFRLRVELCPGVVGFELDVEVF